MKAFLILAHGSRKAQSNEEVIALAERFAARNGDSYAVVRAAFMELAKPDIPEIITEVLEQGATELVILPYFLAAGAHVVEDIPEIVHDCLKHHQDVSYQLLPHIGGADGMVDLIQALATDS